MGLGQVDAQAGAVAAEAVPVGAGTVGLADAALARPERDQVEDGQPDAHRQARRPVPDARHHRAEEVGATGQVAAVGAGAIGGRQQLVEEVAVAVLHVDEVEPGLLGQHRRRHVLLDQLVELVIGEHGAGPGADATVEDRVLVRGARHRHVDRAAVAARVGQLHAGDLARVQRGPEGGEVVDGALVDDQLVRVGPAVGADRRGLAPDQAAPAPSEAAPAAAHQVGGPPVGGAVPPLHGQHGEPVGDGDRAGAAVGERVRLGEGARRIDLGVEREVHAQLGEALPQLRLGGQLLDLGEPQAHVHASRRSRMSARIARSESGRRGAPTGVASLLAQPRRVNQMAASWR